MWREATAGDDARVIELYQALYREDPGEHPADPARARRTLDELRRVPTRGRCVVLDLGGGVLGYALLVSFWSNELGGLVCNLDELYVAPAARGRGHASELISRLAAGDLGFPGTVALELEVSPANERGRALYEREGFSPIANRTLRRLLPRRPAAGAP